MSPSGRGAFPLRVWRDLVEPSTEVRSRGSRREAQLLATLLLTMIFVFAGVDTVLSLSRPAYEPPWYGYGFLVGSYALSRTRRFKVAAILAVAMFPIVTFAAVLSGNTDNPVSTLGYLVLSPALASFFLPVRGVVAFGTINVLVIILAPLLLPAVVPPLTRLMGPLSSSIIAVALAAFYMRHRNQIEADRRVELEANEARLRLALDSARMGILDWSRPVRTAVVSRELEAILGLEPGGSHGSYETLLTRVDPEDRDAIYTAVTEALRGDQTELELAFRARSKEEKVRFLLAKGRIVRDKQGTVTRVTGVVVDVTERQRLEDQLRQAQKMEVVGRLAGGVAHDFNNILTVILGNVELLIRTGPSKELSEIKNAALSASSLTKQLLGMSRQGAVRRRVIDLNVALGTGVSMLKRVIGEDVQAEFIPGSDLYRVKADEGQIQQVVLNLATNARDAMPQGGTLTLATKNESLTAAPAGIHGVFAPGDYAVLTIADSGSGMDDNLKARIFEPFFTTKDAGRGTGLGLAMVLSIVTQSGGFITVDSNPGKGSMFSLYFPRVSAPSDPVAVPASGPTRGAETVLLVEDEVRIRELCAKALGDGGYRVIEASSSKEALEAWAANDTTIDLVISDVVMPGLTGRELAERLLERAPKLRILLISGYAPNAESGPASQRNVAFLQKPFAPHELLQRVRAVLDGHLSGHRQDSNRTS